MLLMSEPDSTSLNLTGCSPDACAHAIISYYLDIISHLWYNNHRTVVRPVLSFGS
jgi:hypothetical protein